MKAKVKNTAVITLIALALVLALTFAVLYAPAAAAPDGDGTSASAASAVVDSGSILSDGDVEEQLTQAPDGYTAIGGDSGNDFSAVRSNSSGNYILMGDITVSSLDTTTAFSGILDGNGYTITVNGSYNNTGSFNAGGLFADVTGTIKNLKVAVEHFSVGVGSSGAHYAGIICGQLYGNGTIENVKVTLNYSPDNNSTGSDCNHYMYSYGELSGTYDLILGGVAGLTNENATLRSVTVENNAEGQGFGARTRVTSPSLWGTNTTGVAVGGVVGRAGSTAGTTTVFENITYTGSANSYIAVRADSTGSRNVSNGIAGILVGWVYSNINVNGFNIDWECSGTDENGWGMGIVNTDSYGTPGGGKILRHNINGTTTSGTLTGLLDSAGGGSISMSNVFISSDVTDATAISWLWGNSGSAGGAVIYPSSKQVLFDKTREGHVIISGAYSSVMGDDDLIFGARIGSSIAPLYDSLIVSSEAEKQTGLYVSAQTGSVPFGDGNTNSVLEWVNPYYGTAQYNSDSRVTASDEGTTAQYTYDYSQAQIYLDTYNGGSVVTSALGYGYTYDGAAVNVGEYEFTLNSEYVYETQDGTKYLADETGGGFADISGLAESITVTVNPAVVTGTVSGDLTVTYGNSLSSVTSGLVLDLQNTYADFAGVSGLDITATLQGGSGETYNTYSGAGSVFDISVASISPNYDMSGVTSSATVTVAKRQVTGYVTVPSDAVYNGQAHAAGFYAYSGSAANNEDISELLTYTYGSGDTSSADAPVNAGSYTVTVSFADGGNYEFSSDTSNVTTSASFEIAKADVTWSLNENQFGYMGNDFTVAWSIAGVNEQDTSELQAAVQAAWADGSAPTAEGTYTYNLTFAGNTNYNASSASVQYSVRKVQVSLSISADSEITVEYGGAINIENLGGGVFTVNGVRVVVTAEVSLGSGVEIGDLNVSLSANVSQGSGVGEYMLIASVENGNDYDVIAPVSLNFEIVAKAADIPAAEGAVTSKVYDGQAVQNLESLFNDVSGAGLVITVTDAQGATVDSIVNAGTYTVTATFASANYSGSGSVTFTVEKANPSPVIQSIERTGSGATVTVEGGNSGVEYSLDGGATWATLPQSGVITLALEEKTSIIFRYAQTDNITGEATVTQEVTLTYDALEENIDSLPDDLTFSYMDSWSGMSSLAGLALAGEKSDTFDSKVSAYSSQADALKSQAQSAVQDAFGTAGALISGSGVPSEPSQNGGSLLWLVITLAVLIAIELVVVALLTVRLRKDKKGGNGKKALGAALFLMGAATYEIALAAVFAVLAAGLAVYIGIAAARIVKNKKNATVEENYEEDSEQA